MLAEKPDIVVGTPCRLLAHIRAGNLARNSIILLNICYCRPMLAEKPDIVVGTPSRLLAHIQAGNLDIKNSLEMIVIDEADLVFSFGYEENVRAILR